MFLDAGAFDDPFAKVKGSYALVSIKKQRNTKSLC